MAQVRVLIVEDDADINNIVATHLTRRGYTCTQAFSGTEARMLLAGDPTRKVAGSGAAPATPQPRPFDIVISDLMLPGLNGEDLIRLIREADADVPILVISARTAATDKIALLNLGADDYLSKPFDLDELVARIEVQLRRRGASSGSERAGETDAPLTFLTWSLDPDKRLFTADGVPVELTKLEFAIVEALMSQPGHAWSKAALFERAWGEPYTTDENTLNVHISNIRAKVKRAGAADYIKTVWGIGFKLGG